MNLKNKIEENLCSFQVSQLLKEKGFAVKTHCYFNKPKYSKKYETSVGFNSQYWGDNHYYDWNSFGEPFKPFSKECISQPPHSIVIKWLEVNFDIYVSTTCDVGSDELFTYKVFSTKNGEEKCLLNGTNFSLPEEAVEAALLYVLKNLI